MKGKHYDYENRRQNVIIANNRPKLQLGDQNDYVKELQNYLIELN